MANDARSTAVIERGVEVQRAYWPGAWAAWWAGYGRPLSAARLKLLLAYTAKAESDFGRLTTGDGGASRGVFHIHESNINRLSNLTPTGAGFRSSPVASGWAAVVLLDLALRERPEWVGLLQEGDEENALAAMRVLWRQGGGAVGRPSFGRWLAEERTAIARRRGTWLAQARAVAGRRWGW